MLVPFFVSKTSTNLTRIFHQAFEKHYQLPNFDFKWIIQSLEFIKGPKKLSDELN